MNNIEVLKVFVADPAGQKTAQAIRFHAVNDDKILDIRLKDATTYMSGFMSISDKNKLDTIASGATADSAITAQEIDALFA